MYRLSQIIFIIVLSPIWLLSQNPHGNDLKIDCAECHSSDSWDIDYRQIKFDHSTTSYDLNGMHRKIDCTECHESLIFSEIQNDCVDCHEDIHNNTLPLKCNICHYENNWLINDIPDIHDEFGFTLSGVHAVLDCTECHDKSVELIFDPISSECYSCHEDLYLSATSPNHVLEEFPTDCYLCHDADATSWIISHDFFPLEKGHDIQDCSACHSQDNYLIAASDCYGCHEENYNNAINPDHKQNQFSTDCSECHTIDPGWSPAEYTIHDANDFPIYSGKHKGEWSLCTDCHLDPDNYSDFTCTTSCHEQSKMDKEHDEENDYIYESNACLNCHPDGEKDD